MAVSKNISGIAGQRRPVIPTFIGAKDMVNLANLKMQIYSTDMSDEERKTWRESEDICPICEEKFGTGKQVRTGKRMFINSTVPSNTIIHKKCCE